jgi:hypothetical protein
MKFIFFDFTFILNDSFSNIKSGLHCTEISVFLCGVNQLDETDA